MELSDREIAKDNTCFFSENKIEVKTNEIMIFEAGSWLGDIDIGNVQPLHKIKLENGFYKIQIQISNNREDNSEDSDFIGNMTIGITKAKETIVQIAELPCYQNWLSLIQ